MANGRTHLLDALVGVAHHSNEQVDEDDDRDEEVDGEDDLEHDERPLGVLVLLLLEVLRLVQAEQGEEEVLEGHDRRRHLRLGHC